MPSPYGTSSSEATNSAMPSTPEDLQATMSNKPSLVGSNRNTLSSPVEASQLSKEHGGFSSPPVYQVLPGPVKSSQLPLDGDYSKYPSSYPISTNPMAQSLERDIDLATNAVDRRVVDRNIAGILRAVARLMISVSGPTQTPSQEDAESYQELFGLLPVSVNAHLLSEAIREALAGLDPATTSPPPSAWLKVFASESISEQWPRILDHRQKIDSTKEKLSRLPPIEWDISSKREELRALKNEIGLSDVQIFGSIWVEKDPNLRDIMLELFKQEVTVDQLDAPTRREDW